ncbi:probable leucine-rich repeat receptor-like protein kinase At1g68400 [Pyrus x bretschneideri]|uniref:probable leucine-rich repeat receptor-like protein kinase At1g68400 n=1 Tax=Pyrus x bretschneideri TaxID=225117 RepID=UPI00202FC72F|nr:probable leucine-rich repeat receptor-like protein kinase At1g68400 [Pyrus x bretschneideri]
MTATAAVPLFSSRASSSLLSTSLRIQMPNLSYHSKRRWTRPTSSPPGTPPPLTRAPGPASPAPTTESLDSSSRTSTSAAPSVTSLSRLHRFDLSYNNLSGEIPATVNHLNHLLTLRLEENRFSGSTSGLTLPNLQDLNVSANRLTGEIPKSFSTFPITAFAQNPGLCGSPMQSCKGTSNDPTRPGSDGAIASPVMPAANPTVVASSPSSLPGNSAPNKSGNPHRSGSAKMSPEALIAIIVGDALVLVLVSLLLYCYFRGNFSAKMRQGKGGSKLLETEKIVYSSSPYSAAQPVFERGRMVFFEGVKRFELEDLLRASAEMLGKGGFGTAYKAVLDDGNVLAVKRLKDAQIGGKTQFEQHVAMLGRLSHPNIVSLRAYYFTREEKLLVYDYSPMAACSRFSTVKRGQN